MHATETKPRSILGLLVISLLFGPSSLMLWLGKWRIALFYLLAMAVVIGLFFGLPAFNLALPASISGWNLADYAVLVWVAFAVMGFLQAMVVRRRAANRPWYSRWYVAIVAWPVLFLGAAQVFRAFGFQTFDVLADSTAPNLITGDSFIVSKWAYGYSRFSFPLGIVRFEGRTGNTLPRRGDIAVFKLPADTNIDYVKRVIGLPGDHIQVIDGVLQINGEPVKRERISDYVDPNGEGLGTPVPRYRETLPNGVSYETLDAIDGSAGDNTNEYVVPPGHYFVMGDNRDNSEYSRFLSSVGYVPVENFVGPALYVYWNRMGAPIKDRP
jgi:signal peptidase I